MRVIAENIANADSTKPRPGANPYRRKIPTFRAEVDRTLEAKVVALGPVRTDPSDSASSTSPAIPAPTPTAMSGTQRRFARGDDRHARHPALLRGQLNLIWGTRRMIQRTIDILRA